MKKLEPGKFSDVIETPEACFVIYLEGRRPAHDRPLNEVRATIEKELRDRERRRLGDQWIRRLKNKTFVRYFQ